MLMVDFVVVLLEVVLEEVVGDGGGVASDTDDGGRGDGGSSDRDGGHSGDGGGDAGSGTVGVGGRWWWCG